MSPAPITCETPRPAADDRAITVAVFDDNRDICHGLRDLLNDTPGFRCVLAALSLRDAIDRVARCRPDVVILDIQFPRGSGLATLAELRRALPDQKVLMHSVVDASDEVLLAFLLGASGYLLKGDTRLRIASALEIVTAGGAIFSPGISQILLHVAAARHSKGWILDLTPAELEVLHWIAKGHTAPEIAQIRNTSVQTVHKQCEAIREKAEVKNMKRALAQLGLWSQVLRLLIRMRRTFR
jgi:DNA-binding NarL/FixJ family response regulator